MRRPTFAIFAFVIATYVPSARSGIIESHTLWPASEVRICWAKIKNHNEAFLPRFQKEIFSDSVLQTVRSDFTDEERKLVQNAVQREYTSDRTGIHFEGWNEWSPVNRCDALVFGVFTEGSVTGGDATIGYRGDRNAEGFYATTLLGSGLPFVFLRLNHQDETAQLTTLALHEFGHLSGLRHEIRPMVHGPEQRVVLPPLPACATEALGSSATRVTEFDNESIMNRCGAFKNQFQEGRDRLSELDVRTLRGFYP